MNSGNEEEGTVVTNGCGSQPTPELDAARSAPESWVFTFGFGHVHPATGTSLANCYIKVRGDRNESREAMNKAFGNQWAFQYPNEDEAGVDKYKLRPLITF